MAVLPADSGVRWRPNGQIANSVGQRNRSTRFWCESVIDGLPGDGFVDWSETDLQFIPALQIHPRAPWSLVGAVLGVSPATVARRWARLNDAGLAWATGYRACEPQSVEDPASAMVIARCRPPIPNARPLRWCPTAAISR
ncbi:AsnC family protein [Streptomyces antibioticus]